MISLPRLMRYDLFVDERYDVSRISDTYKKSFICILLKHRYIPHLNHLLLIPDLFVRPMMTCFWRHYRLHDASWRLNKQKRFFTIKGKLWRHKWRGLGRFIVLLTLLRLVKLMTRFEHHYCSRAKFRMGGTKKPPIPSAFEAQKSPCQIGLIKRNECSSEQNALWQVKEAPCWLIDATSVILHGSLFVLMSH